MLTVFSSGVMRMDHNLASLYPQAIIQLPMVTAHSGGPGIYDVPSILHLQVLIRDRPRMGSLCKLRKDSLHVAVFRK